MNGRALKKGKTKARDSDELGSQAETPLYGIFATVIRSRMKCSGYYTKLTNDTVVRSVYSCKNAEYVEYTAEFDLQEEHFGLVHFFGRARTMYTCMVFLDPHMTGFLFRELFG